MPITSKLNSPKLLLLLDRAWFNYFLLSQTTCRWRKECFASLVVKLVINVFSATIIIRNNWDALRTPWWASNPFYSLGQCYVRSSQRCGGLFRSSMQQCVYMDASAWSRVIFAWLPPREIQSTHKISSLQWTILPWIYQSMQECNIEIESRKSYHLANEFRSNLLL